MEDGRSAQYNRPIHRPLDCDQYDMDWHDGAVKLMHGALARQPNSHQSITSELTPDNLQDTYSELAIRKQ